MNSLLAAEWLGPVSVQIGIAFLQMILVK